MLKKVYIYIITAFFAIIPWMMYGDNKGTGPGSGIEPPLKYTNIMDFVQALINNIVMPIGVVVVVFFIIYSGFLFVIAQGNETKLATAKKTFLFTVIGAVILLGAWTISEVIKATMCQIAENNIPGLCN